MISEPARRISSCSRPTALVAASSERKELEQTSSASPSVLCASVMRWGRISCSTTGTPGGCDLPRGLAAGEAAADDVDGGVGHGAEGRGKSRSVSIEVGKCGSCRLPIPGIREMLPRRPGLCANVCKRAKYRRQPPRSAMAESARFRREQIRQDVGFNSSNPTDRWMLVSEGNGVRSVGAIISGCSPAVAQLRSAAGLR